jgi:hypothetical protein
MDPSSILFKFFTRSLYSFSQTKINPNYAADYCFEFDFLEDLLSNFVQVLKCLGPIQY